jgi:hypothetical protein
MFLVMTWGLWSVVYGEPIVFCGRCFLFKPSSCSVEGTTMFIVILALR